MQAAGKVHTEQVEGHGSTLGNLLKLSDCASGGTYAVLEWRHQPCWLVSRLFTAQINFIVATGTVVPQNPAGLMAGLPGKNKI